MKKYIKQPIPIKAEQFNYLEVTNYLCNYSTKNETIPFWIGFFKNQFIEFKKNWKTLFEKK